MKRLPFIFGILGVLGMSPLGAEGGPVTFRFVGTVEIADDPDGILGGNVSPGMVFTGCYTFESTEPDADTSSTWGRYYYDNIPGEFSMVVNVGPFTFITDELDPHNYSTVIYVRDNDGSIGDPRDSYSVSTREFTSGGESFWLRYMKIDLSTDDNLDVITSDALLLAPPDLLQFESNRFTIFIAASEISDCIVRGPLTDLSIGPSATDDTTWGRIKELFR